MADPVTTSDIDEAAEMAYWEGVVEKSIRDAVVRKAEVAAHEMRQERLLLGIEEFGAGWFAAKLGTTSDMLIEHVTLGSALRLALATPVTAKAGDTVTFTNGALQVTSE